MGKLKRLKNTTWVRSLSSFLFILSLSFSLKAQDYTGEGVKIAIFDAGFLGADKFDWYKKLEQEGRILGTYNLVNEDGIFSSSNHGTSVLSIIAGDGNQLQGSAPKASFYLFITEDVSRESIEEEYTWGRAMEMADSLGVEIINSSLSYTEFDNSAENHKREELDGRTAPITNFALQAARKGMLVVCSAGNYANDPWGKIGFPADADSIISVGAIDKDGRIGDFSSYGPTADGRIKPELVELGVSNLYYDEKGLRTGNGTSFSAPVITGFVAKLKQAFPEASAQEIRRAAIQSANMFDSPNSLYGYGVPNLKKGLNLLKVKEGGQLFLLVPNPVDAGEVLRVVSDIPQADEIIVLDALGRVVKRSGVEAEGAFRLPANLNPGHYFVHLQETGTRLASLRLQIRN